MDTVDTTHDISNDARRVLYIVMAGAQGGGASARAAQQVQDKELAEFFRNYQTRRSSRSARPDAWRL